MDSIAVADVHLILRTDKIRTGWFQCIWVRSGGNMAIKLLFRWGRRKNTAVVFVLRKVIPLLNKAFTRGFGERAVEQRVIVFRLANIL